MKQIIERYRHGALPAVACPTLISSRGIGVMVNPDGAWRSAVSRWGMRWSFIVMNIPSSVRRVERVRQSGKRLSESDSLVEPVPLYIGGPIRRAAIPARFAA